MFGETEYDPTNQYAAVPIEEQLEALGSAVTNGKACINVHIHICRHRHYLALVEIRISFKIRFLRPPH